MQTQREVLANAHRATDSHKHHADTDLEAPVVWLLLRGKTKRQRGKRGREEEKSQTFSSTAELQNTKNQQER